MNISSLLGFLLAGAVFVGGVVSSTNNWMIYLNAHALVIVLGGTLAATLISFPFKQLAVVSKVIVNKVFSKSLPQYEVIEEVVGLARGLADDPDFLNQSVNSIRNHFLKEAVQLQIDGGISDAKIDAILRKRVEVHFHKYEEEAHLFKTVARFPPAFGLLGAVTGMIALMGGLGSPDSFKMIGPAMAVAMVATLYGIAFSNFILVPMGENLSKWTKQDHLMRNIVLDSLKLLRQREHPLVVEEHLKSYFLSSERSQIKSSSAKAS